MNNARLGELVDPADLDRNLSALLETVGVELVKFGEGLTANTEPSFNRNIDEGVETRRRASKAVMP